MYSDQLEDQIDRPGTVRRGDELDAKSLLSFLKRVDQSVCGEVAIEQYPAGFSNLTYLLHLGERELILRRPPHGATIKTAHDMGREYRILSGLHPVYKKVPRPVALCDDESVIGAPFYLMERVTGVILRSRPPAGINLSSHLLRRLSVSFIETLVEIHELDYRAAGLGDLGHPAGYVRRQIEGWTKRYANARTGEVKEIEELARWLEVHQPPDSLRSSLIHNDYKYDNLVLNRDDLSRPVAILDWEMATIGDPLMDLGTSLGYWIEATDTEEWQQCGFVLTGLPGNLTRRELLEHYAKARQLEIVDPAFYYAYGLLKIAVIAQQIYFRYRKGLTTDERFARLGEVVRACGAQALRAIEKKRIDALT